MYRSLRFGLPILCRRQKFLIKKKFKSLIDLVRTYWLLPNSLQSLVTWCAETAALRGKMATSSPVAARTLNACSLQEPGHILPITLTTKIYYIPIHNINNYIPSRLPFGSRILTVLPAEDISQPHFYMVYY